MLQHIDQSFHVERVILILGVIWDCTCFDFRAPIAILCIVTVVAHSHAHATLSSPNY